MKRNVLAFDFGASSGRAIIGKYDNGNLELEEIHRFTNAPIEIEDTLYWDLDYLFLQVVEGIKLATQKYKIASLAVDTWGVDYGLLDKEGKLLENPVHYRDKRTQGIIGKVEKYIPSKELYKRTGNQIMEINTLFQLLAFREQKPLLFEKAETMLLIPDLINYLLTGKKNAEQSIASTTQLMNPITKEWDWELISMMNFPESLFPPIVSESNYLGKIKKNLGLPNISVFNICEHDTASAVVSIPNNQNSLFVSCGTWSLIGTEISDPIINEKARSYNLTNESGNNKTTRFLKNCTGLWIIQEIKRNLEELGRRYSYTEITKLARLAPAFKCLIDTDAPAFATPGNIVSKIYMFAKETNQQEPENDAEIFRCVYESLAFKYKYTFQEITDTVEKEFNVVNIIGGGSQADILCEMVADASGMCVSAGPVEATAIGNITAQLVAQGVLKDIAEARELVRNFENIIYYQPKKTRKWDEQFIRYKKILRRKANI